MLDLKVTGYAEVKPSTNAAINQLVWYLLHHPAFHANKPGNIRLVFDYSAKCDVVSLNDVVSQGPDLTNKLAGVLLRFR